MSFFALTQLANNIANGLNAVFCGDSMVANINAVTSTASAIATNGVVLVNQAGHGMGSGTPIDFNNATLPVFNVRNAPITRIDANNFTFVAPGAQGAAVAQPGKQLVYTNLSQFNGTGFFIWLSSLTAGSIKLLKNAGVTSNTTLELLNRFQTDVLSYRPNLVGIRPCLYNDTVNNNYTADQINGWIFSMVSQSLTQNAKVVLISPPAFQTGNTTARYQTWLKVMKYMADLAQSLPGVAYADAHRLQVDATNATPGFPITGMLLNEGGLFIHESARGCYQTAKAINNATQTFFNRINVLTDSSGDNWGTDPSNDNILDFAPWAAAGGVVNAGSGGSTNAGTCPAGFKTDLSGGAATVANWSGVARSDGIGFDIRGVIASDAGTSVATIQLIADISNARFAALQKLKLASQFKIANIAGSGFRSMNFNIQFKGPTPTTASAFAGFGNNTTDWIQEDGTYTIVNDKLVVPSDGVLTIGIQIQFIFSSAGSAVTIDSGAFSLRKIS